MGEPQVKDLTFVSDGRITGSISVVTQCTTCGTSKLELDVEVEAIVPCGHRETGHELEIDLKPAGASSRFPAKVICSCGRLSASAVVVLRRGN